MTPVACARITSSGVSVVGVVGVVASVVSVVRIVIIIVVFIVRHRMRSMYGTDGSAIEQCWKNARLLVPFRRTNTRMCVE